MEILTTPFKYIWKSFQMKNKNQEVRTMDRKNAWTTYTKEQEEELEKINADYRS